MIRRFVSIALGAVMLHLNIERADIVCALHPDRAMAAAHNARGASGHRHEMAGAPQAADAPARERCQTPSQPDCCQALVSCSTLFAVADTGPIAAGRAPDTGVAANAEHQPSSRRNAPEPPPPRL